MVLSNQIPATASTTRKPSITIFSTLRLRWSSGGSDAGPPPSVIGQSWLRRAEGNLAAIIDDTIARFVKLFTSLRQRIRRRQVAGADRRLAVAAGNVEHIFRLAQPGDLAPQGTHQLLPLLKARAQVCGTGREIAVVQVIGLDAAFHEGAHQRFQRRYFIV